MGPIIPIIKGLLWKKRLTPTGGRKINRSAAISIGSAIPASYLDGQKASVQHLTCRNPPKTLWSVQHRIRLLECWNHGFSDTEAF